MSGTLSVFHSFAALLEAASQLTQPFVPEWLNLCSLLWCVVKIDLYCVKPYVNECGRFLTSMGLPPKPFINSISTVDAGTENLTVSDVRSMEIFTFSWDTIGVLPA